MFSLRGRYSIKFTFISLVALVTLQQAATRFLVFTSCYCLSSGRIPVVVRSACFICVFQGASAEICGQLYRGALDETASFPPCHAWSLFYCSIQVVVAPGPTTSSTSETEGDAYPDMDALIEAVAGMTGYFDIQVCSFSPSSSSLLRFTLESKK